MKEVRIKIKEGKVEIETLNYKGNSCEKDAEQIDSDAKKLGVSLNEIKNIKKKEYYNKDSVLTTD